MTEERRAAERGIAATATTTVRITSRSFWAWFRHNHIDGFLVLMVMLWLTIMAGLWVFEFPYDNVSYSGTEVALIIGAVLTPIGATQALLFNIYVKLKGVNGGPDGPAKS